MEASSEFLVGSCFALGPGPARTQYSPMHANNNNSHNNNFNHFMVDDLLDFSKDGEALTTDGFSYCVSGNSSDDSVVTAVDSSKSSVSGADATQFSGDLSCCSFTDVQFSGSELCVPYDDLAELEWLSNFVEESFSSDDLHFIPTAKPPSTTTPAAATDVSSPSSTISTTDSHNSPSPVFASDVSVPGKARSKRSRAAPYDWSSRLLLLSPPASPSENTDPIINNINNHPKLAKTTSSKRRESTDTLGRKCLHCESEKTPQWRAGPLGPKTLCNACGVRYKSGRLVPEYRPAASPTFVSSKHSNSHRKVIELRRQKDLQRQQSAATQQLISQRSIFCPSNGAGDYMIHQSQQIDGPDFSHMI